MLQMISQQSPCVLYQRSESLCITPRRSYSSSTVRSPAGRRHPKPGAVHLPVRCPVSGGTWYRASGHHRDRHFLVQYQQ
jgi:hypothetical protein